MQPLEARGAGDLASREASLPVQGGWVHELPASTWGTSTDLDLNNSEEWRKLGEQYNALGQLVEDTYFTAVTVVETVTTFGAATAARSFAVNSLRTAAREVAEQSATQLARNTVRTGGGRVFWSGEGAMNSAMNYAKSTGGTTLEMTRAGQNLQNLITTRNIPWAEARPMWERLSSVYARGANGTVHFFQGTTVNPGSIWLNIERKILLQNGVNIITH